MSAKRAPPRGRPLRVEPSSPYPLEAIPFILPAHRTRVRWELALDTRQGEVSPRGRTFRAGDQYPLEGRSLALLRLRRSRGRS